MNKKITLAEAHPELAAQWHPTKNEKLTPELVTCGSHKKVWWLLPYDDPESGTHFDFEWKAQICNRVNGRGCPYLSGYAAWSGYNDLATKYPDLAKLWHPTKNGKLTPDMVMPESDKKFWWFLAYDDPNTGKHHDFEWYESVYSLTRRRVCPFLRGTKAWPGFNDLSTTHPELSSQWHPIKNGALTPEMVASGSGKRVWWLLPYDDPETGNHFDFEWIEQIDVRAKGGFGCPFIPGQAVWVGYNDLATKRPDIAKEWHPTKNKDLTPEMVTCGSGKMVWWLMPYDDPKTGRHFDFEWKATIVDRIKGNGCPYLTGKSVWPGYNDLLTRHPELASQWHYAKNGTLTPEIVSFGSNKKVWWLQPYDDPATGKHFDFEWEATINSRTSGIECPYLSGKAVWAGFNDLATMWPEISIEWHPTRNRKKTPAQTYQYSSRKVWWLCPKCGHEWYSAVSKRTISEIGCPTCRRKRAKYLLT